MSAGLSGGVDSEFIDPEEDARLVLARAFACGVVAVVESTGVVLALAGSDEPFSSTEPGAVIGVLGNEKKGEDVSLKVTLYIKELINVKRYTSA